jgi:hypothetical protein
MPTATIANPFQFLTSFLPISPEMLANAIQQNRLQVPQYTNSYLQQHTTSIGNNNSDSITRDECANNANERRERTENDFG